MRTELLPLVVVPLGFIVVGLVLARVGFRSSRSDEAFVAAAARAPGVLTELRWRSGGRPTGGMGRSRVAFPVVRFTAADGREVEVETNQGRSPAPGKEGQSVTVLYDPTDPTRVMVEDFIGQGRVVAGCVGGMGIGLTLFGLLFAAIAVFFLQALD